MNETTESRDKYRTPRLAVLLLRLCLPYKDLESALGDLEEEYGERLANQSPSVFAKLWFYRQTLSLSGSFLFDRLISRRHSDTLDPNKTRGNRMETLLQDVRFGLRSLLKRPVFAAVAVLTMALGIGANSAIFSIVNSVLLRALPFKQPDQLVRVWGTNAPNHNLRAWMSYPDLQDRRSRNTAFQGLGGYINTSWTLTGTGEPEIVSVRQVTEDVFPVLDMKPFIGRLFTSNNYISGQDQSVILSYEFWQQNFGGDPNVLGKTLTLEEHPFTIVGILPPGNFRLGGVSASLWAPLAIDNSRGSRALEVIGRLKSGAQLAQADAEMTALSKRFEQEYPQSNKGIGVRLEPLQESLVGDSRSLLLILLAVVGFVLLIACANVTNLFLSRLTERRNEISIRTALGASGFRIARQLLTESVILTLAGGFVGMLFTWWIMNSLIALSPKGIPRLNEIAVDRWVLGFTLLISLIPGIVIGFIAAIQTARPDASEALKGTGRSSTGDRSRNFIRNGLVIAEIALTLILTMGAGLLLKSFWRLENVNPGFRPQNILTMRVTLPGTRYPNRERALAFYNEAISQLRLLPGVTDVATVNVLPLSGNRLCNDVTIDQKPVDGLQCAESRSITSDYFRVIGISLLNGRSFTDQDNTQSPQVTVINKTLAGLIAPHDNAIGKRFFFRGQQREVVGIVDDIKHFGLNANALPEAYLPLAQQPNSFNTFVIHTQGDPTNLAAAAQKQIWVIDHDLPIQNVRSLEQVISDSIVEPRFRTLVIGAFSILGLLLAVVGMYSVIAYGVGQRRHEIGIRMAIGAQRDDILQMVLVHGLRLLITGVLIGIAGSFALTRVLETFLFNVSTTDISVFAAVPILSIAVVLMATYFPARRAAKLDPMIALRCE